MTYTEYESYFLIYSIYIPLSESEAKNGGSNQIEIRIRNTELGCVSLIENVPNTFLLLSLLSFFSRFSQLFTLNFFY